MTPPFWRLSGCRTASWTTQVSSKSQTCPKCHKRQSPIPTLWPHRYVLWWELSSPAGVFLLGGDRLTWPSCSIKGPSIYAFGMDNRHHYYVTMCLKKKKNVKKIWLLVIFRLLLNHQQIIGKTHLHEFGDDMTPSLDQMTSPPTKAQPTDFNATEAPSPKNHWSPAIITFLAGWNLQAALSMQFQNTVRRRTAKTSKNYIFWGFHRGIPCENGVGWLVICQILTAIRP